MKNKTILACLLLVASIPVFAQDKGFRLGLRFAPNIATSRITDVSETDNLDFESNGVGVRFSAGLTGDFYFSKNYSFYTGLWYTSVRSGIKYSGTGVFAGASGESIHNLQYVQLPVGLKLFTNEIATDMKLYFVLGGTAGIKINEKEKEWKKAYDGLSALFPVGKSPTGKAFSYGDVGLLVGMGVEYQMGESTTLFGGFSYNRGLLDIAFKKGPFNFNGADSNDRYRISANLVSLEAGIKF